MRLISGTLVIAITLSVPAVRALSGGRLVDVVDDADEIFVGTLVQVSPVPEGMELSMTAERIIKGDVLPRSTVRAIFRPRDRREKEPVQFRRENGAFFLKKNASSPVYEALRGRSDGLGHECTYIPLPELHPAPSTLSLSTPVIDKLHNELISGLNRRPDDIRLIQVIRTRLSVNQSPLVMSAYKAWLDHPVRYLRIMAAAGLINTGYYDAAVRLQAELKSSPRDRFVISAGTAFASLPDSDPRLVLIAGELSLDPSQAQDVRNSAVHALVAVHTKETLPFLYEHLKDPRTIFDTPETRVFATFRRFSDKADEERRLQFRKTWYDTHRGSLR